MIGFDLNPLAVMAARTNYLIAIRDLVGHVDRIEIPIYLCDSIMTPSEHGGLFVGALGKAKELKTAAARFIIPTEITTHRDEIAKYAEQLEFGVRNGYSSAEFVQRCRDEGLSPSAKKIFTTIYMLNSSDWIKKTRTACGLGLLRILSPPSLSERWIMSPGIHRGLTGKVCLAITDKLPHRCGRNTICFATRVTRLSSVGEKTTSRSQDASLEEIVSRTSRKTFAAEPIVPDIPTSPWLTVPNEALAGVKKALGQSAYSAKAGTCTWLNGVYWIRIIEVLNDGNLLVENLHNVGRIKVPHLRSVIEPELVYPLLRGRDVSRWQGEPSAYIILANRTDKLAGIAESEMKLQHPKTFAYLKSFESQLRKRSGFKQYFKAADPFYSMYNVGPYTLAPWKVLWAEVGHTVRAGVCGPQKIEDEKPALPDHTIVGVSCESKGEAHFICALLNSCPAQLAVRGYVVLHPSPHILEHIAIPRYNAKDARHKSLAKLSEGCHLAAAADDESLVLSSEAEIDQLSAAIWGITEVELSRMQKALREMVSSKGASVANVDDDTDS